MNKLAKLVNVVTGRAEREEEATIAEVFGHLADDLELAIEEQNWTKVQSVIEVARRAAETLVKE